MQPVVDSIERPGGSMIDARKGRPPDSGKSNQSRIRAEQIRLLQSQSPISIVGMSMGAILLAFLLWDVVGHSTLIIWALAVHFWVIALALQWMVFRRSPVPPERMYVWAIVTFVVGFGSGCTWASAGFLLFVPGSLEAQLFLLMMLFTGVAGGTVATIAYFPTFLGLFLPFLVPLIIRLVMEGRPEQLSLAAVALVYLSAIGVCAYNIHRMMSESLRLRFKNAELVNELTARTLEAEQANLAKSRFLAAASHDLRQPLHALGLFVSALEARITGLENQDLVNKVSFSVNALEGLFNALLDVSRLDAGVLVPQLEDSPVQPVFDRIKSDYESAAMEKGLEFIVDNCFESVHTDPVLLERLLRNLVSNAIKNTRAGRVQLECLRCGDNMRIGVRDSGIGIPEENMGNIFEEFYQVDNPERDRNKGLGLGLAIVSRIAKLLEHRLEVSSAPDEGSVFSVEVPIAASVSGENSASVSQDWRVADLAGKYVVVVEDDVSVQDAMKLLLNDWGCNVLAASTVRSVLETLANNQQVPDLVIADYRLPEETTGVHAIDEIRAAMKKDIPAILITGDTAPDRLRDAEASGYPLLHKPVPPSRLRALVSYTLEHHKDSMAPGGRIGDADSACH